VKRFGGSLGARLFLTLLGVMAVVFALYAYLNDRSVRGLWLHSTEEYARQTSDLIKSATRYGMLLNRKDDVHQTIRRVAEQPGIAGLRIYDKLGRIMFSADEREIGTAVDVQAEACVQCHKQSEPLRALPSGNRVRVFRGAEGQRFLGLINPIENARECSNAACHAHPESQTILGVLDVKMSMPGLEETMNASRRSAVWGTLVGVLLLGATAGLFIWRMVRVPVARLMAGAERVASGDLSIRLPVQGASELDRLAETFNRMIEELSRARSEITDWSVSLEEKVKAKTEELGRSQRQVVQMEKMASLGKLAASVAHELNNPLAGILNYAKLLGRMVERGELTERQRDEVLRFLTHIQRESGRCGDIVRNLLLFARRSDMAFGPQSLNEIVDQSLMVVAHHLQIRNVKPEIGKVPGNDEIVCDGNAVQQALVAMCVNAVEAMPEGGTLSVRSAETPDGFEIQVQDTGMGIRPEDLPHIFEPFFSTKADENGVGLGLAVVYGIVQRHGGRIDVESKPNRGTLFRLFLPKRPPEDLRKG
jgi:two-component system NtrC family sensor kinase